MRLELTEQCSDHDLPVIDIVAQSQQDAFHLAQIMQRIRSQNLVCWCLNTTCSGLDNDREPITIRIPLVLGNELNLVPKTEKE